MGTLKRTLCTGLLCSVALSSGCSVADCLGYEEITQELDAIARLQGSGPDQQLHYAERAEVSTWYMHSWFLYYVLPLRPFLGLFGSTSEQELENPSAHVRELCKALPAVAQGSTNRTSDSIVRLLRIAELDPSPANRVVALDGASWLLRREGIRGIGPRPEQLGASSDAVRVENARAALATGRPEQRPEPWPAAAREQDQAALETLTERPLDDWSDRLGLIGDLLACSQAETAEDLRTLTKRSLQLAKAHAVRMALWRCVQGRQARYAQVRLCAMQLLRRLGGPEAVPALLAMMATPAAGTTSIRDRFDPDPLVQLTLVHMCGQLCGELAQQAIQLEGREEWDALSPIDFLAQTILSERDYYSKLRVPALAALSLSLGKPKLDYDVQWVEQWYRTWQRGT